MKINQIEKIINQNYWSINLGIARSFLALCTLVTLLFNPVDALFSSSIHSKVGYAYNFFYIFGNFKISIIIAAILLIVVMIGMYPRYTCILHFWVAYSFSTSGISVEGGDQIVGIASLLLIPVLLFDKRKNHYSKSVENKNYYVNCIAFFSFTMISLQSSFLYFQAALGKIKIREWADGTAVYYWFNDNVFGVNNSILEYLNIALKSPVFITLVTWGAIAIELFIALAIFFKNKSIKITAFYTGIALHLFIALCFGLISFFFAMAGVLILYLIPYNNLLKSFKRYKNEYIPSEI